jgi:hypothetical protein
MLRCVSVIVAYLLVGLGTLVEGVRAFQMLRWTVNASVLSSVIVRRLRQDEPDVALKLCQSVGDVPMVRMTRAVIEAAHGIGPNDATSARETLRNTFLTAHSVAAASVREWQFVSYVSVGCIALGLGYGFVKNGSLGAGLVALAVIGVALLVWSYRSMHEIVVVSAREMEAIVDATVEFVGRRRAAS